MAEKRMFAKTIIDSDAFIDMPVTARLLYYDLGMRADDDGFVNSPKKIMRMIGASQDDLSLLIMKKFIIPFDSGIVVIKHWRIHNYIRKDMYHETKYKDEKNSLYLDENNAYTLQPCNEPVTNLLQPCNEPVTNLYTQDSIDKTNIDKTNINTAQAQEEAVPYKKIMELYHSICKSYPTIRDINGDRKKAVSARYKANPDLNVFKTLFEKAEASSFLKGENDRKWKASFDWLMRPSKFDCVLEGKYDNKQQAESNSSYDMSEIEQVTLSKYKNL